MGKQVSLTIADMSLQRSSEVVGRKGDIVGPESEGKGCHG